MKYLETLVINCIALTHFQCLVISGSSYFVLQVTRSIVNQIQLDLKYSKIRIILKSETEDLFI